MFYKSVFYTSSLQLRLHQDPVHPMKADPDLAQGLQVPQAEVEEVGYAVVVDLPFVPVIDTMGACGAARKAISTSLIISICAAAARAAAGCGVGCRCGIPGLITRASRSDHGQSCHGMTVPFGKLASGLLSSWANMVTPAASSAATAAMPELPRPRTPTV